MQAVKDITKSYLYSLTLTLTMPTDMKLYSSQLTCECNTASFARATSYPLRCGLLLATHHGNAVLQNCLVCCHLSSYHRPELRVFDVFVSCHVSICYRSVRLSRCTPYSSVQSWTVKIEFAACMHNHSATRS